MIKLIKNELFKIFHKKSIYIFGLITLGFCILNNVSYKLTYDEDGNYISDNSYIDYSDDLDLFDPNNENEVEEYVNIKTSYDTIEMLKSNGFSFGSWQYMIANKYFYNCIYNINYYTYIEKSDIIKEEYVKEYNELVNKFKNNDWKYFANLELERVNNDLDILESYNDEVNTTLEIKEQEERLFLLNLEKEVLKLRLDNDISYANSYLNDALINYYDTSVLLYGKDINNLDYDEKVNYQELLSDKAIYKYIIDTKDNVLKENNLKTGLSDLILDYEIFIMIFIIVIASSIVSSEFKGGTIKLLLTKPYTRNKILLSKYITSFISLCLIIVFTFICQFLVGSICFGMDSLEIPVLVYNYNTNNLIEYNAIIYMLLMIGLKLPMYILMLTFAFCLSTLFSSSSIANTFSILGYLFKDLIYVFVTGFNFDFLKYFVTLNWDFSEYLYGRLPIMEALTLSKSMIVCLLYYLIIIITTFIVFRRKNIKNI